MAKPPKKSPPPKKSKTTVDANPDVTHNEEGVGPVKLPTVPRETEQVVVVAPISDEEKIRLINMTLAPNTFMLPQGGGTQTIRVKPFEASPLMPISWAKKIVGKGGTADPMFSVKGARLAGWHWRNWAVLRDAGERDEVSFKEPTTGQTYNLNQAREKGALNPVGKPLLHTEVQAILWLRNCPNNDMIAAFIHHDSGADTRPVVRMFAQDIMALRTQQENERTQIDVVQRRRRVQRGG